MMVQRDGAQIDMRRPGFSVAMYVTNMIIFKFWKVSMRIIPYDAKTLEHSTGIIQVDRRLVKGLGVTHTDRRGSRNSKNNFC